jgi:predicted AAA+ superfamily ATPase
MKRNEYLKEIDLHFQVNPVLAILGARQVGKTTLAKIYIKKQKKKVVFFDLEDPTDLAKLENPMLTLSKISNALIVIDEIQRKPELFSILRVLVDEHKKRKFLILGSASRDLIKQSSETLAGRISYIELTPFSLKETKNLDLLWLRGGFPRSYLASNQRKSFLWRKSYIKTFLEMDIPNLGFQIPPDKIRRFWLMLAHCHGQIFNASELGKSLEVSSHTTKKYLDILAGTFMIRNLPSWYENLKKRQVKSPKIYFRDNGILLALLQISDEKQLNVYPKLGSLWEGFALEEVIKYYCLAIDEAYFWATQGGAELDLMILKNGKRIGFEFKYTEYPKITKSMLISIKDLNLDHLYVVFPSKEIFPLSNKITAKGIESFYF